MLAIIPAKKNSKRLPNKNIKLLNGKPLIAYTIQAAKKSKVIDRIIVSTDCPKIASISRKYGAEVPFYRPKKLTGNKIGKVEVCRHVIKLLNKKEAIKYENIIVLQPTSPLRIARDIDESFKIFKKKKANSVISFSQTKPMQWYYELKQSGKFKTIKKNYKISKKSKINFVLNGAIYIFKTNFILKYKNYKSNSYYYIMPKKRSVDIDDIYDFKYAEYIISEKKNF